MDRFQAIHAFREVASQGGFAAAARAMNTSPPTVSRLISDLEEDLGVRLFNRSTRTISLTEDGEQFLRRGASLVDELDTVFEEIRDRRSVPTGRIRITSIVAFGQVRVAPTIPGFIQKYPKTSVELEISNRMVDIIQEHFDIAIRIGGSAGLEASSLKARKIFSQKLIFVATPEYVAAHGAPAGLEEIDAHLVVKQVSGTWGQHADLRRDGETRRITLPERFVVNSPNAARNAILGGSAIGLCADYLVRELLENGRLVRLLPEWETEEQPIYAVFVHRHFMPAKVRAFLDHLVGSLGGPLGADLA